MTSAVSVLAKHHRLPTPPAPRAALALLIAVVEGMLGRRPLHQLRPHVAPGALDHLTRCVDSQVARRMQLGRVRTQMPTARAVEAVVKLTDPTRPLVCVVRLDAPQRSWTCTELVLLTSGVIAH